MNWALLGKWEWGLLSNENSLCLQVLRNKYLHQKSFLDVSPSPGDSWSWKSIYKTKSLIQKITCRFSGDRRSTIIWKHLWVLSIEGFKLTPKGRLCLGQFLVANFILEDGSWDLTRLLNTFDTMVALKIPYIRVPKTYRSDFWF
ncbi:hypothetical protein PanWU01x14_351660 [Parasponia andersonii]|uniref:Uncharacterized protein n=1 Tax=Parasponia andersonii TaxID=3476 RepID=A0A2P5AAK3_PARAD|nr:hypothetical protein PanWU01x14_351660 [Parasponia andersonii]